MDANSRQDAVLMLSSVNLPGGVQVGTLIRASFPLVNVGMDLLP